MCSGVEVYCIQVEVTGPAKEDNLIPVGSDAKMLSSDVAAQTAVYVVEEGGDVEREVAAGVFAAEVVCPASDEVRCSPEMKV